MSGSTRLGTSECLIPPQSGSFSVLAVSGGWSIITSSCGVGLDHYVQVLQDKRMQHGWTYGDHYLPHDIVVKEFTSGKSRRDTLAGKGTEATMSRLQTSLMASTLFGGCWDGSGSTPTVASAAGGVIVRRRQGSDHIGATKLRHRRPFHRNDL